MKRGEVWTVSDTGYAGKPRPAVIIQADQFEGLSTVTLCAFTSDPADAADARPLVRPSETNGLRGPSRLMVDKITTVRLDKLGQRIGNLETGDIAALNGAILMFLGLGG